MRSCTTGLIGQKRTDGPRPGRWNLPQSDRMVATPSNAAGCPIDGGRRRALAALPALLLISGLADPLAAFAQAGLDVSAIERAAAEADLHSVLVWRTGSLLVEHYRRSKDRPVGDWFTREVTFGPDVLHDLRSISKSVVALLIGQAVARGEIDIDAPVLDFYPALAGLRRDGREAIRISHLLDMASGLAWTEAAGS